MNSHFIEGIGLLIFVGPVRDDAFAQLRWLELGVRYDVGRRQFDGRRLGNDLVGDGDVVIGAIAYQLLFRLGNLRRVRFEDIRKNGFHGDDDRSGWREGRGEGHFEKLTFSIYMRITKLINNSRFYGVFYFASSFPAAVT